MLEALIALSALLCALVAGFVFAFAVVVMPGVRSLDDRNFLLAFKAMDRVIQNRQPVFMLVWVGSILALVMSSFLGLWRLDGVDRMLLISAAAVYILGVQLPTVTVNVPLNNRLHAQDLDAATQSALHEARSEFEDHWIRWNAIRTVFATLTSALLLILLLRL